MKNLSTFLVLLSLLASGVRLLGQPVPGTRCLRFAGFTRTIASVDDDEILRLQPRQPAKLPVSEGAPPQGEIEFGRSWEGLIWYKSSDAFASIYVDRSVGEHFTPWPGVVRTPENSPVLFPHGSFIAGRSELLTWNGTTAAVHVWPTVGPIPTSQGWDADFLTDMIQITESSNDWFVASTARFRKPGTFSPAQPVGNVRTMRWISDDGSRLASLDVTHTHELNSTPSDVGLAYSFVAKDLSRGVSTYVHMLICEDREGAEWPLPDTPATLVQMLHKHLPLALPQIVPIVDYTNSSAWPSDANVRHGLPEQPWGIYLRKAVLRTATCLCVYYTVLRSSSR